MCGIFGVINSNEKIEEGRVLATRDVLAHRGPDDAGLYLSCTNASIHPNVALAHRRLSIIDLSPAAHQPMTTPDGRYTIVFNGEIYNFRDLIPRLTFDISRLTSSSDTEVILYLYAKYGKDCLKYLRGMFAFAIWDDKEKTLFAARDRFGIKPFYYYKDNENFIFASELKAIKHYKSNLTINNDAVDAFLRTGSVPAPLTIYNKVSALLPGHYLTINNSQCKINNYWKFSDLFGNPSVLSPQSTKGNNTMDSRLHENDNIDDNQSLRGEQRRSNLPYNENAMKKFPNVVTHASMHPFIHSLRYDDNAKKVIRNSLLDAISAHLVSDVEVGAFLSGGIDSTAIVSLMRQVGKEKIKTVSIVFPDSKFDESKYSRLVAKKYKTEHIEIPFYEKDLLDDFENIMAVMDQPTIDGINTYFVSKAAKQAGLKVVLSGLGGDELFGGYPSFNLIPKYQRIKNLPLAKMFMKFAAPLLKNKLPAKAVEYMKNPNAQNSEYKLIRGLFTNSELQAMGWNHATMHTYNTATGMNEEAWMHENEWMHGLVNVSFLESCYYIRNQLLRDSDIFSMAHSIELRVPFIDHILYAAVLPYLDDAYDKNFPKKMLVEAVGDIPEEIIHRPKMGFTFPFEEWIRNGQLKDLINMHKQSNRKGKLNPAYKLNIYNSKLKIDKFHWSRFWALFVLDRYFKE